MYKKILVVLILIIAITSWYGYKNIEQDSVQKSLAKNVVRFHVLANSNSSKDQAVKLKVKEKVVSYINKHTSSFSSPKETVNFLKQNDNKIKNIAKTTLNKYNFYYDVNSSLGTDDFPEKTYGNITFPKGKYFSYRILLGKSQGHNFWCVLYPSLCFVDASTGSLPESSKNKLRENLTDKEYDSIVKYKFKYLTFLNKYIN